MRVNDVFRVLINSLVLILHERRGPRAVSDFLFQCNTILFLFTNKISISFSSACKIIVQELCVSRGGRPELSVLTSLLVSVDVKNY